MRLLLTLFTLLSVAKNTYSSDLNPAKDTYETTIAKLTEKLETSKYTEDDFNNFLTTVHTINPTFPKNYNEESGYNPFVIDVMRYIMKKITLFKKNDLSGQNLDEEDIRLLIGAVNTSLMDIFSNFHSENPEQRKKIVLFIICNLKKLQENENVSAKMKQELSLNEIIYGIHHLEELLSYQDYQNPEEKKKEWMNRYWGKIKSHKSKSQYLNLLGSLLLIMGHDEQVDDPLHPFFPPSTTPEGASNHKNSDPKIRTINNVTSHAKKLSQKVKEHFDLVNEDDPGSFPLSPTYSDNEMPDFDGSQSDEGTISPIGTPPLFSKNFPSPTLPSEPSGIFSSSESDLELALASENQDDYDSSSSMSESSIRGKRASPDSDEDYSSESSADSSPFKRNNNKRDWDKKLEFEKVRDYFISEWNKSRDPLHTEVLKKFGCEDNTTNREGLHQIKGNTKQSNSKVYEKVSSVDNELVYVKIIRYTLKTKIDITDIKEIHFNNFNREHSINCNKEYFFRTYSATIKILTSRGILTSKNKTKKNNKFDSFYQYAQKKDKLSYADYDDYSKKVGKNAYNKNSFIEYVSLYNTIQKMKP